MILVSYPALVGRLFCCKCTLIPIMYISIGPILVSLQLLGRQDLFLGHGDAAFTAFYALGFGFTTPHRTA
ncbi:uncharacterized protein EI90DRAFT_3046621, partial [Cantharellus anzutake]|uniref:uncharacterized protein n=1 Tax=Cantharellus anzutake TaxID=1750568 RepID=UPI0019070CA0